MIPGPTLLKRYTPTQAHQVGQPGYVWAPAEPSPWYDALATLAQISSPIVWMGARWMWGSPADA